VMWPTEARATPDEKNTIRFPVLLAKPRQQVPVRPGLLFFVPEENDAIIYSATAEMDSYTLKSTFAFRE
uniref:hypothetical protein n=2 Tax=Enterobacteriaceae TaxID=543 RepID=UPI0028A0FF7B